MTSDEIDAELRDFGLSAASVMPAGLRQLIATTQTSRERHNTLNGWLSPLCFARHNRPVLAHQFAVILMVGILSVLFPLSRTFENTVKRATSAEANASEVNFAMSSHGSATAKQSITKRQFRDVGLHSRRALNVAGTGADVGGNAGSEDPAARSAQPVRGFNVKVNGEPLRSSADPADGVKYSHYLAPLNGKVVASLTFNVAIANTAYSGLGLGPAHFDIHLDPYFLDASKLRSGSEGKGRIMSNHVQARPKPQSMPSVSLITSSPIPTIPFKCYKDVPLNQRDQRDCKVELEGSEKLEWSAQYGHIVYEGKRWIWDLSNLPAGSYKVTAILRGEDGNESSDTASVYIERDNLRSDRAYGSSRGNGRTN